jgi:NAD(P)-dependent dehydrogenase (short-subunit alcohol dehydrogenase family)
MSAFPMPDGIKTYHTKPYPAIDVTRPELSVKGKVVVITGGGLGLGLAFSHHFAKAGCNRLAITGRRLQVLDEAKKDIEAKNPGIVVLTLQSDVVTAGQVDAAFDKINQEFGKIDVLVNNAGYLAHYGPLGSGKGGIDEWWKSYEVNVKGGYNVLNAFLKSSNPDATVINLTSAATNVLVPGQSAYGSSKMAGTRLFEYFQLDHPSYRVVNIAPGVVLTEMHERTIAALDDMGMPQLPLDDSRTIFSQVVDRPCS